MVLQYYVSSIRKVHESSPNLATKQMSPFPHSCDAEPLMCNYENEKCQSSRTSQALNENGYKQKMHTSLENCISFVWSARGFRCWNMLCCCFNISNKWVLWMLQFWMLYIGHVVFLIGFILEWPDCVMYKSFAFDMLTFCGRLCDETEEKKVV